MGIILDKTEKEYILNIIKPFKNRIISITKKKCPLLFNQSFIKYFNDTDIWYGTINSPIFATADMFQNMKADYEYTVEELDL